MSLAGRAYWFLTSNFPRPWVLPTEIQLKDSGLRRRTGRLQSQPDNAGRKDRFHRSPDPSFPDGEPGPDRPGIRDCCRLQSIRFLKRKGDLAQMRQKLSRLSKSDLVSVSEIAYRSLYTRTRKEMEDLLREVSDLVPTTGIVSGFASADPLNLPLLDPDSVVNGSFSQSWLSLYLERGFHRIDPVFRKHFGEYKIQVWTQTYRTVSRQDEKEFIALSRNFGLDEGVTMGHRSPSRASGSCFSFSGSELPRHERHIQLLECLLPHLHVTISKLFLPPFFVGTPLTAREKEALTWKKEGLTAWEISRSMKISERTVVFHLRNAMRKLGARNSAQAMAAALSLGLID